jgi:hypothetical protein
MIGTVLIGWFLSFGLVPEQRVVIEQTKSEITTTATVAELGISAEWWRVNAWTSIENYQYYGGDLSFKPYLAKYKIGASFRVMDGVEIIATHECDHEVLYTGKSLGWYGSNETQFIVKLSGGFGK